MSSLSIIVDPIVSGHWHSHSVWLECSLMGATLFLTGSFCCDFELVVYFCNGVDEHKITEK